MGRLDQLVRRACHADPAAVPERLMRLAGLDAKFIDWHDTRSIAVPGSADRTADLVARLDGPDAAPWLLTIEFQGRYDADKIDSTLEQVALMRAHLREPVTGRKYRAACAIAYVGPGATADVVEMILPDGRGTRHAPIVWDVAGSDASSELAGVATGALPSSALSWIPLMSGADQESALRSWLDALKAVSDPRLRFQIAAAAQGYAETAGLAQMWEYDMGGVEEMEARLQAFAEAVSIRHSVLTVLEARFPGRVTDELKIATRGVRSIELLNDWLVAAATVPSYDDFLDVLRG